LPPIVPLLSRTERDRLRRFICLHEARLAREAEAFAALEESVENAHIVESDEMPCDVVTLYSRVRLRETDTGRTFIITVALPAEAESSSNASFWRTYATAALLGAREGDEIVWRCADGLCRARIEEVLVPPQPSTWGLRVRTSYELSSARSANVESESGAQPMRS